MKRGKVNIITDERCVDYGAAGHPERPARIRESWPRLKEQTLFEVAWLSPKEVTEAQLLRAHTKRHVEHVRTGSGAFDGDTPRYPEIAAHVERSVGGALQALRGALEGDLVFSLMRPPGHHATRDEAMGFCYFNSVAVAVLEAQAQDVGRVAVLDFDVHHGNGTEAILLDRPGTVFYSVHQHPCYPGTGTESVGTNCFNFPVPPRFPRASYREVLEKVLEQMGRWGPDLVVVSAGFDAYAKDPIAQETLEAEDFCWLGRSLRALEKPFMSVLEGGYSDDLPELIEAYLQGVTGAA